MAISVSAAGASLGFQKAEVVCALTWPLCESCREINIERLSEGQGYPHSWLEVLEETAKWCTLCSNLFDLLGGRVNRWHSYDITPHRYKVTLSLDLDAKYRKARPDHYHNGEFKFKCILVEVFDIRPWESPDSETHPAMIRESAMKRGILKREQQEVSAIKALILCHTQEGDPAMAFGLPWLRNVEYTGSSGSMKVVRGWLQQCLATDDEVFTERFATRDAMLLEDDYDAQDFQRVTPFSAEWPTRLLKIVPSADDADKTYGYSVKLMETREFQVEYEYAALSYCWGKMKTAPITHTWLTKRMTIEQHRERIDLGCLPATIRDCIKIAFSLGICFVWVDSLCIIQDDSSDWEAESAKMGGIYRGALLTIAASRCNSSSSGLFNWSKVSPYFNPFDDYLCVEGYLRTGEKSSLYFEASNEGWDVSPRRHLFREEVYNSPLSRRAWVYQEQMLSRRTLYFAESQLYWECDHCRLCQDNSRQEHSMRETYSIQNFKKPLRSPLFVKQWYCGAVEAYTKRALTYPEDRMVAISAVAKATYMNRHVRYVAGLWEDCILAGLCWYRDSKGKKDQASLCPSWSWASQLSSVSYREIELFYDGDEEKHYGKHDDEEFSFLTEDQKYVYMAKVLNIQVETSEKNPFGHVQGGQIVLRAWATAGTVTRNRFGGSNFVFQSYAGDSARTLVISEDHAQNDRTGMAVLDDDGREDQDVMIAMVIGWDYSWVYTRWLVMLLDMADENKQIYRRIGLGMMEEDDQGKPDFEGGWKRRDITII